MTDQKKPVVEGDTPRTADQPPALVLDMGDGLGPEFGRMRPEPSEKPKAAKSGKEGSKDA